MSSEKHLFVYISKHAYPWAFLPVYLFCICTFLSLYFNSCSNHLVATASLPFFIFFVAIIIIPFFLYCVAVSDDPSQSFPFPYSCLTGSRMENNTEKKKGVASRSIEEDKEGLRMESLFTKDQEVEKKWWKV